MMKNSFLTLSVVVFSYGLSIAQSDLPPNAVPGKCYAKCLKPAQFTTRTEQYISKEAGKILSVSAPELTTTTEQVLVKEGGKVIQASASAYKTVTEQVMVKEPSKRTEIVAGSGSYKAITDQMETRPAYKRYEIVGCNQSTVTGSSLGKGTDANAPCFKPSTEQIMVREGYKKLDVIPAQFKTETEQVIVKEASKRYEVIPAVYKTITEQYMVKPAYSNLVVDNTIEFKAMTEKV
ncbi:MAG: hypothetical protein ACK4YV_07925, partial [Emticicia sp.]